MNEIVDFLPVKGILVKILVALMNSGKYIKERELIDFYYPIVPLDYESKNKITVLYKKTVKEKEIKDLIECENSVVKWELLFSDLTNEMLSQLKQFNEICILYGKYRGMFATPLGSMERGSMPDITCPELMYDLAVWKDNDNEFTFQFILEVEIV